VCGDVSLCQSLLGALTFDSHILILNCVAVVFVLYMYFVAVVFLMLIEVFCQHRGTGRLLHNCFLLLPDNLGINLGFF
jgi:hypothetical protein